MVDLISVTRKKSLLETQLNFGSSTIFNSRTELCNNEKDVEENTKDTSTKEKTGIRRYCGMLFTLAASVFFSSAMLIVKVLNGYGYEAYASSFWRYVGTTVPCIPLLMFYECGPPSKKTEVSVFSSVWPPSKGENWKTILGLFCRGIFGASSVILRYFALQYLTLGDTAVITYSTPVLVTVLAHFFLGEKCGIIPIVIAITTFCGVVVITKPPIFTGATGFDSETLKGTGLACGSLFCSAIIVIITRKIRGVQFAFMTLVFGVIGVVQAFALTQIFDNFSYPVGLYDSLLVLGLAAFSFFGQMSIILALKFEQAGPVSLIRTSEVVFGFLLQFIFLGVSPDEFSSIGGIIVLSGVVVTGLRKWLSTLPADDVRRQKFCCLLK